MCVGRMSVRRSDRPCAGRRREPRKSAGPRCPSAPLRVLGYPVGHSVSTFEAARTRCRPPARPLRSRRYVPPSTAPPVSSPSPPFGEALGDAERCRGRARASFRKGGASTAVPHHRERRRLSHLVACHCIARMPRYHKSHFYRGIITHAFPIRRFIIPLYHKPGRIRARLYNPVFQSRGLFPRNHRPSAQDPL